MLTSAGGVGDMFLEDWKESNNYDFVVFCFFILFEKKVQETSVPDIKMAYLLIFHIFANCVATKHTASFLCDAHLCSFCYFSAIHHHEHTVTYLTLSSGRGERSLLAVWSCEGHKSSVLHKSFYFNMKICTVLLIKL